MKKEGKNLGKYTRPKVPTGEETKMELKMSKGRAWLRKGWKEFVDKYSIRNGYTLNFQYYDGSWFDVITFDKSRTEIVYPIISPSSRDEHARRFNFIEISDDDSDDEVSDECAQKAKGEAKMKTAKQSGELETIVAKERAIEKAKSFHSPYPHFITTMTPTYDSGSGVSYLDRWSNFATSNDLKAGDVCAFELVSRNPMELNVTIFRLKDHIS